MQSFKCKCGGKTFTIEKMFAINTGGHYTVDIKVIRKMAVCVDCGKKYLLETNGTEITEIMEE